MPAHTPPLIHRVAATPEEAKAEILGAYRTSSACLADAAVLLGVSLSTLKRVVVQLDLRGQLDAVADEAREGGWHHGRVGGRPRLSAGLK